MSTRSTMEFYLNKIFESGIAQAHELKGCSQNEIEQLEKEYGRFNQDYKVILQTLGHKAGQLINRFEFNFYYDQIIKTNQTFRQRMKEIEQECLEEGVPEDIPQFPTAYFIISARYGTDLPHFILTDSEDLQVYMFTETEEIKVAYASVWEWFDIFITNAQHELSHSH